MELYWVFNKFRIRRLTVKIVLSTNKRYQFYNYILEYIEIYR